MHMSEKPHIIFCSRTHVGKVRRNNEDFLQIYQNRLIAAIADGIGGDDFGEVASQIAVDASVEYLSNADSDMLHQKPAQELGNAIKYANEAIIAIQRNEEKYRNMGSTLSCFWITDKQLHFSCHLPSFLYK